MTEKKEVEISIRPVISLPELEDPAYLFLFLLKLISGKTYARKEISVKCVDELTICKALTTDTAIFFSRTS